MTAYNLLKPDSSTQSWRKLLQVIDEMNLGDWLIVSAGEIDCRIHIYYQAQKQKESVTTTIMKTSIRYGAALLAARLLVRGRLGVLGIPPPGDEPANVNYPPACQLETRLSIYRSFNFHMKEFCRLHEINYLDVYNLAVDELGYFKEGYAEETAPNPAVHLNREVMRPIVLKLLQE